jgi:hypothetical protein
MKGTTLSQKHCEKYLISWPASGTSFSCATLAGASVSDGQTLRFKKIVKAGKKYLISYQASGMSLSGATLAHAAVSDGQTLRLNLFVNAAKNII